MDRANLLECLEALLVFAVPLLVIIPFYVLGSIAEGLGNIIVYVIYIACSIALTKYNGRSLVEIGLTRKGLLPSLGNSVLFVLAFSVARFMGTDLKLSPHVGSWDVVAFNLFFWFLSGSGQEILFRGLILFSFNRWKDWKVALLVSSVLFGLVHVQRYQILGIILECAIGAVWGWIALKTKNIIGPMIAHSLFNFVFAFLLVS